MGNYTETVTKLRDVYRAYVVTGNEKAGRFLADAADAIEALQDEVFELEEQLNDADIAADDNGRQVEKLARRNAEFHAELGKWVSAAEKARLPKRDKDGSKGSER